MQHQVFEVLSLACVSEMKRKLNIVFSKGLFYSCWIWICQPKIEIEVPGLRLHGSSSHGAFIPCFWNQGWAFDFHRGLRPAGIFSTSKAPVPIARPSFGKTSVVWSSTGGGAWEGALSVAIPKPWVPGVWEFSCSHQKVGLASHVAGQCVALPFPPACCCTRQ